MYSGERKPSKSTRKYGGDDLGDDLDDSSDGDMTDEVFLFSPTDQVSFPQPMWNFRWRGRSPADNHLQRNSDKQLHSIMFSGKGGARCAGTFGCDWEREENVTFTEAKVELEENSCQISSASYMNPRMLELEWRGLNEDGSRWWDCDGGSRKQRIGNDF
jgi:hypothetical protein